MPSHTPRIEDYAMIGDCRSAALVGIDGSIDWLCWPRFDSPACFAALLGEPGNGRWLLAPKTVRKVSRHYRDTSLVLETEFEAEGGRVRVTDFMPVGDGQALMRRVTGLSGRVAMHTELVLRFDYGYTIPWVRRTAEREMTAVAGPHQVVLRSQVQLEGENMHSAADFEVGEGETVDFVLAYAPSFAPLPSPVDVGTELEDTEREWHDWAAQCRDGGPWNHLVRRSLMTLRALTYRPTGGIIAAATTSLPEKLGGERNWDYRYCWLRDASFTLQALMQGGYYGEAKAWRDCNAPSPAAPSSCRSSTAWPASATCRSASCRGCPASAARSRYASATPPPSSCSWTSSAKFPTPCTGRATAASRPMSMVCPCAS